MSILKYIRYIFLFAFLLLHCGRTAAEETDPDKMHPLLDSLKNILRTQTPTEKEELNVYWHLAGIYAGFCPDSIFVYAPKLIELAGKYKEYEKEADGYCHLGVAYCFREDYDSALYYLGKVRELGVKLEDKEYEARALSLIGFIYLQQGKYNTSIDYYLKVLALIESGEVPFGPVVILTNLAEIYRKLNNSLIALQYLDRAVVYGEELIRKDSARYQSRMAHIYTEYAANYLNRGDMDLASEYAWKAEKMDGEIMNDCFKKTLLADICLLSGDYDRALEYAGQALKLADMLEDKVLYLKSWTAFSDIYLAQGRYAEAEVHALKAIQADSTNIDESRSAMANLVLANIHLGNMEKAARYFNMYSELNRQYTEKSYHTTVSDWSIKYETDKKEMRISDLEREKWLYVLMGIVGILLAGALGTLLWQKVRSVRKEKQLIATRSVLDGEMRERTRLASDLHDRLSGSLAAVKIELHNTGDLQTVSGKLDACIEEIRRVAHNLMPVSLQFGMRAALGDFTAQFPQVYFHFFGREKRVEERVEFVVYCCVNELVNNALRHSGAKSIDVQLIQDEEFLSFTVQDDGCGFDEKIVTGGIGLKSVRDRITSCDGKMDIFTSPGHGTEVTIELKIEKSNLQKES